MASLNELDEKEALVGRADSLLNAEYRFFDYDPVTISKDHSWKENPYSDRSWNWRLHNMGSVVTLSRAYESTRNKAYLQRAEDLVLDWIRDNTLYVFEPPSEFTWHDHATAFRLLNWLYFFEVWKSSSLASVDEIVDPEKCDSSSGCVSDSQSVAPRH